MKCFFKAILICAISVMVGGQAENRVNSLIIFFYESYTNIDDLWIYLSSWDTKKTMLLICKFYLPVFGSTEKWTYWIKYKIHICHISQIMLILCNKDRKKPFQFLPLAVGCHGLLWITLPRFNSFHPKSAGATLRNIEGPHQYTICTFWQV
jgi:hypothetical protein